MSDPYERIAFINPARELRLCIAGSVIAALGGAQQEGKRRPESKETLERRQAALFTYGRSLIESRPDMDFGMIPIQDDPADMVIRTPSASGPHSFEPVQLKEIVPEEVNVGQTLDELLTSIRQKYGSGSPLTIAININRETVTTLGSISDPNLPHNFWFFGLCGQNRGFLVANPFNNFTVHEFPLPKMPSSLLDI